MMVLRVGLEMARQLLNARREQRNLNLRRTAVIAGSGMSLDYFSFACGLERHQVSSFPFSFLPLSLPDRLRPRKAASRPCARRALASSRWTLSLAQLADSLARLRSLQRLIRRIR